MWSECKQFVNKEQTVNFKTRTQILWHSFPEDLARMHSSVESRQLLVTNVRK